MTKAVLAACVVFVPAEAVGIVGTPVTFKVPATVALFAAKSSPLSPLVSALELTAVLIVVSVIIVVSPYFTCTTSRDHG